MARTEIKFNAVNLTRNCAMLPEQIQKTIVLTVDYASKYGEGKMKAEAPWTDRTGAARTGLFTDKFHAGTLGKGVHRIVFGHSVDYGIWLEVANSGRYQIIMPTVKAVGTDLMKGLEGMLNHPGQPIPGIFKTFEPSMGRKGTSQGVRVRSERQGRRVKRTAKRTGRKIIKRGFDV